MSDIDLRDRAEAAPRNVAIRNPAALLRYVLSIRPGTGAALLPGAGRAAAPILADEIGGPPGLPDAQALQVVFDLTEREAAVARQVPTGRLRRQIGRALGVSENAIKTHLSAVLEKTGARNVRELAMMLARL